MDRPERDDVAIHQSESTGWLIAGWLFWLLCLVAGYFAYEIDPAIAVDLGEFGGEATVANAAKMHLQLLLTIVALAAGLIGTICLAVNATVRAISTRALAVEYESS